MLKLRFYFCFETDICICRIIQIIQHLYWTTLNWKWKGTEYSMQTHVTVRSTDNWGVFLPTLKIKQNCSDIFAAPWQLFLTKFCNFCFAYLEECFEFSLQIFSAKLNLPLLFAFIGSSCLSEFQNNIQKAWYFFEYRSGITKLSSGTLILDAADSFCKKGAWLQWKATTKLTLCHLRPMKATKQATYIKQYLSGNLL